jgi:predicted Zn-dependent peptidase
MAGRIAAGVHRFTTRRPYNSGEGMLVNLGRRWASIRPGSARGPLTARFAHVTPIALRSPSAPPALPEITAEQAEAERREAWGPWEDARRSILPSGLRLVTARLPRSGSVSLAVGVEAGSRHESDAQSGISHVLEHMCFRGSERWPSSFRLTSAIEELGGTLDGYTHREATVYYSRLPRAHIAKALDVIFDMVQRPRLAADDFEVERDVVLEEIHQDATASAVVAEEALDALLWPGHPLSRAPVGTEAAVRSMTAGDVRDYWQQHYAPNRAVVAVAGDVEHGEMRALVEGLTSGWQSAPDVDGQHVLLPAEPQEPELESRYASGQTTYVYAGVRGLPSMHPDRPALELLSCALGELASSRLWADLRDQRGLAYDVGSEVTAYADSGGARMWAGVPPRRQAETVERMIAQADQLQNGLDADEFERARSYIVGELTMSCETSEEMAHWLLWSEIAHHRLIAPGAARATYESVTPDDVRRVATLWAPRRLQVAIAGPAPRRAARLRDVVKGVRPLKRSHSRVRRRAST